MFSDRRSTLEFKVAQVCMLSGTPVWIGDKYLGLGFQVEHWHTSWAVQGHSVTRTRTLS